MSANQDKNSMSVSSSSLGMQIWSNDEKKEQSKQKEELQEMLNNCSKEIKEMLETVMTNVESGGGAAGSSGSGAHSSSSIGMKGSSAPTTCSSQTPTTEESTGVSSTASTQTSTTDDMSLLDLQKQLAMLTALLTQIEQKVPSAEVKTLTAYNAAQVSEMESALNDYNTYVSECNAQMANYNAAVAANQSDWEYQAVDHQKDKNTTPVISSNWWNPCDSNTKTVYGDPDAVASEIEQVALETTGIVVNVTPSSSADDMIAQANAQVNAGIQTEENAAYVKLEQQIAQCGPIGQLLAQELKSGEKLTPLELAQAIVNILQTEMAMLQLMSQGGMAALLEMIRLFTDQSNKAQISSAQLGAATSDNTMAMNQASSIIGKQLQAQEERSLHGILQKQANLDEKAKSLKIFSDIGMAVSLIADPKSAVKFLDRKAIKSGDFKDIFDGKHTGAHKEVKNDQQFIHDKLGMNEKNSKLLADSIFILQTVMNDPASLLVCNSNLLESTNILEDAVRAGVTENNEGMSRKEKEKEIRKGVLGLEIAIMVATIVISIAASGGASAMMSFMGDMAQASTTAAASLFSVSGETAAAAAGEIELIDSASLTAKEAARVGNSVALAATAGTDGAAAAAANNISTAINQMSRMTQALMMMQAVEQAGMGTASGVLHIEMSKLQTAIGDKTYDYETAQSAFEWVHNIQELTQTTNNAAVKSDSQVIQETQKSQTQMLGKLLDWQAQAAQMA